MLQGWIGSASLALGGPINADIARRIACDAQIISGGVGAWGEPLDVGRAKFVETCKMAICGGHPAPARVPPRPHWDRGGDAQLRCDGLGAERVDTRER
ncbi:MAG: hypothetical protein ACRDRY_07115 [Pseudonocardiaceae bacterium]